MRISYGRKSAHIGLKFNPRVMEKILKRNGSVGSFGETFSLSHLALHTSDTLIRILTLLLNLFKMDDYKPIEFLRNDESTFGGF